LEDLHLKISVVGSGYVGLVTGGCLAEIGHDVVCTDSDPHKIQVLEQGNLPIYEPGLDAVIAKNRRESRLRFEADPAKAVRTPDAIFICVGTPPQPNGDADLSAIDNVARVIAAEARGTKLVVEKSTVPAQTGQQLQRALGIYGRGRGVEFRVASNPEFLREGTAVSDFLHPDRIVVGVDDPAAEKQLHEIYRPVLEQKFNCPVHNSACPPYDAPAWMVTTINSAELIKHASNSFLALKISYANMVADLAEKLGADVEQVLQAVGKDARIGTSFFRPGLGFGGFCLPKDLQAFVRLAERSGVDFALLKEVEKINQRRIDHVIEKVRRALWVIRGKKVGVLGLAFKANTDDIRFAPAIELVERLIAEGAHVRSYDPKALEKTREARPKFELAPDAYQAAEGADVLVIATEWPEFRKLDWARLRDAMARPLIVDARNLLAPADMRALGFEYHGIGRIEEEPPRDRP
jgi:UDPglucose 6-dehydrogenase